MRKFVLLTMTALLLAGCSGGGGVDDDYIADDPGGDQAYETDEDGNRVVKIWFHVDSKSAEGGAYQKRVDAFNAAYAEQKIKARPVFKARTGGSAADYEKQLIAAQTDGSLGDVITLDAPNCASYADSGLLYNITSAFTEDEKKDFLSLNMYKDRVFGLPIQESSAGFYYNKNIFRDAGIDVSGYTVENPWTFSEFKSVCQKLKDRGLTAVDMRLDATKDETATYLLYPIIYAAGGDFVSADGYTATGYFNKKESKDGFKFLKDLVTNGYTRYDIGATDFFTGKTGMYLSSGWTIPDLDHKFPDTFPNRESWGLLPYPKEVTRASATGSWSYAVTRNGVGDKQPAIELIKWMSSAESSNVVTNATGMIPARKSCNPSYADGSPEKILLTQLEQTGRQRPATVGYPQFTTAFSNIIVKIRDNDVDTTVDEITKGLQAELDKLANQ